MCVFDCPILKYPTRKRTLTALVGTLHHLNNRAKTLASKVTVYVAVKHKFQMTVISLKRRRLNSENLP